MSLYEATALGTHDDSGRWHAITHTCYVLHCAACASSEDKGARSRVARKSRVFVHLVGIRHLVTTAPPEKYHMSTSVFLPQIYLDLDRLESEDLPAVLYFRMWKHRLQEAGAVITYHFSRSSGISAVNPAEKESPMASQSVISRFISGLTYFAMFALPTLSAMMKNSFGL